MIFMILEQFPKFLIAFIKILQLNFNSTVIVGKIFYESNELYIYFIFFILYTIKQADE